MGVTRTPARRVLATSRPQRHTRQRRGRHAGLSVRRRSCPWVPGPAIWLHTITLAHDSDKFFFNVSSGVKTSKAQNEQMFSGLPPKADFRSALYEYTP